MSMINEQVKELRTIANNLAIGNNMPISLAIERFRQAANTIEALSAKVVDDVPFCGKGYEEKGGVEENEVGNNR